MLSGVFLKSIGLCLISESSSDVELHLGDNYIAVADLAQILQNREDKICISVLFDGSVILKCEVSKQLTVHVYVNGVLCDGDTQYSLQAKDVLAIDSLQNCFVLVMDTDDEEDYDDFYRAMPVVLEAKKKDQDSTPDVDAIARQIQYHNAQLAPTHRSLVEFLMRQAAEKVRRRNTDKISDAVVITPFSSLEPVTSAGLDVSVGTGGAVGTAFLLSMSHVVLMCYLFHVHIVYAPGCNKTGGVGREFYSLYVGDEEELLVVCDRGALQAQASDSSRYRIASRPYTCLLEYVNLSADIGPDAQTHLQQGYLQDVSVRLECLLCSSYAVLSKLSSLGSSGTSSFSPPPGPVGTKGGVKLLSAASPYSVWGTYLRRSGNSDDNYAQESRVNSLNMARNALDFVTSISSLVVDALFAPVSAGSKPATPTGCLPPTFYTYRKAVTFESWVMLLAKILTFLSGVAVTPPPSTSFGSPTAGKAIINNQQKSLIGCEGDNGFMLNDIENFPTGFKLSASANTPGVGSLSGSSPTKPYVNYEVKSIYSILLCSLDIGNRYRRTDQGSLYGQDGAASAEESADCRCEVCRSILQANVEVSLQTVLLLRVKYAFQAGVGGDDSLPLSKFTDDYLELVSKLRLRYAHLCVPGVSQQVCVCSSSEAGMRPSTPGKGRGGSAVVKDGLSPLVKTKVTTTGSGDGGNVLAARSTRSDEQLSQEVDLQGQLREIDRQIQESIGGDREGSGSVAPKQVPLQSQEPTVQSAGGARVWQNLSPLQLDEPSDTPSVSDVAAPAKPAGTPTGQYLKETISSQLKMRNKEDGGAEDTGDNSSTSNTSVSPKPKSPTRIPRFSAPKSPPRSTSPPVPALRARADGDRRDAWPTEREQNSVQSESKDLSSNKSKASPSRSVTPAPSHPGSGSKPPSSRTPAYYIETPSSFSVISVDSEGRLVKGQNSALSSSGVSKQSSDSDEEGDTWRDVGGSSSEEDDYDPAVDAGLTSFCDDIVYNISPPRNQLSPTSLQKSSPSQYTEVSTGRGGSGTGGGSSTINSSDGSRRRLTSVATMSSRRSSLDRPPDEKRNFLRRTSTSVGFGGSGEATGGVSRSLFGSGRGIKEDLALKEAASRARIPSLELYASPVTGSVLLKTHPHLFAPFAPAPYHVKNRREATELLNTIENSTALWIVFYYYAKRQNSRDGQARMRKEVTRSYLSCYKPPSQPASPDGKPLSPATPAPGTPLDPQIETSINTILAALPGAMDHLGEINSTDVSTNGGTGMPSATYNSVTSEKFHILSPVLVLQFLKEFNLLPAHLRTGVNGNGTPASTGAYNYLYSLYVGVTQEAVTFSSRAKHTSPTAPSTTSGAGGAHRTGTVSPGVRSADAAEGADLSDEVQVTMPVGVVATYMNFLMFQKVVMNVAVELQYNKHVCRNLRKGSSATFSATPEPITAAMRQRQQVEAMERIHSRRQDNASAPSTASAQAVQRKRILASLANAGLVLTPTTPSGGTGSGGGNTWKPRTPDSAVSASDCIDVARDGTVVVDAHKSLVRLLKMLNAAKDRTKAISNASHNRPVFVLDL